jgi:hypothetical protein
MSCSAAEPDIDIGIGVDISALNPHHCGIIIVRLGDTLHECAELERHHRNRHAQPFQVLLYQIGDLHALAVAGTCDDGEFHRLAAGIGQRAVGFPGIACRAQQPFGIFDRLCRTRNPLVQPELIARCDLGPQGDAVATIHQAHQPCPVHGQGNSPAKTHIPKPSLLTLNLGQPPGGVVVQVEQQEVKLEAWTGIAQLVAPVVLILAQLLVVFRAQPVHDIGFPGLKAQRLGVLAGHKKVSQLFQVRQRIPPGIHLPVVRVLFQRDSLTRNITFHPKRPQARHLGRGRAQTPHLGQLAFAVRLLQQMPGQNREAVKQPFGGSVRLGQPETHRVRAGLLHLDGLPADDQQIAIRRVQLLVEIDLKREDHIIRVKRMAIGKLQPAAQLQRVNPPVF